MNENDPTSVLSVAEILGTLDIQQVVCVDDTYGNQDTISVERVLALAQIAVDMGQSDTVNELMPFVKPAVLDSPRGAEIRNKWPEIPSENRQTIIHSLADIVGGSVDLPSASLDTLHSLLPKEGVTFAGLSPQQWDEKSEELFADSAHGTLLCFFDLDLDGSNSAGPNQRGVLLLNNAASASRKRPTVFAILTQKVSVGSEVEMARDLCKVHGLAAQDVIVISKDRLQGTAELFVEGLRTAVLNGARDMLAHSVRELHECAAVKATERLKQLELGSFEHMVIARSASEGIWEAETLFRLYHIAETQAFEEQAYGDYSPKLQTHITSIRRLRGNLSSSVDTDSLELLRSELLQEGESVNGAHLPVELGDIFEIGSAKYVAIGQSCDLQLRCQGKRKASDVAMCRLRSVPFYESTAGSKAKDSRDKATSEEHWVSSKEHFVCRVPYLFDSDETLCIDMRYPLRILLDVLDLASLNSDGRCKFDMNMQIPDVHESLGERLKILVKRYTRLLPQIRALQESSEKTGVEGTSDTQGLALVAWLTHFPKTIAMECEAQSISFGAIRCGRLRRQKAQEALARYVSVLGRPAAEVDLFEPQAGQS